MAKIIQRIEDLTNDEDNLNKGTARGLDMVGESLRMLGAGRSILVDKNGKVIAGNKTLSRAAELRFPVEVVRTDGKKLVVVVREDLDLDKDSVARRLSVVDNRSSEVGLEWDIQALAVLLEQDKQVLDGLWSQDEFGELLASIDGSKEEVQDPEPQIDRAEELRKKWGVELGQVWRLGRHIVACLDSTIEVNIRRVFAGTASFVWADPPYGISIVATNESVGGGEAYNLPFGGAKKKKGNVGGGETIKASPGLYPIQMRGKGLSSTDGAKPFGVKAIRGSVGAANIIDVGKYAPVIGDETTETARKATSLFLSLYPKALQIWWGANYYAHVLPPSSCWLVWDKENTGNFADAELAWCSDKSAVRIFHHMWNGLMKDSERGQRRVHPTQKPVALPIWAFEKYGTEKCIITDPFLGSGISIIAAEQMPGERQVCGFELSPDYVAVTIQRWVDLTGKKPKLIEKL